MYKKDSGIMLNLKNNGSSLKNIEDKKIFKEDTTMRDQFLSEEEMELENGYIDTLIEIGEKNDKGVLDVLDDIFKEDQDEE